jgi:quinol-cytochrome oxidoreductase complex cytochrome b subunit
MGTALQEPSACVVARVGGAGLLTLGVACWLARSDTESSAARGLVTAMVVFNLVVALVLAAAGLRFQQVGVILWPAVVLHTVMTAWCIVSLRNPSIGERLESLAQ